MPNGSCDSTPSPILNIISVAKIWTLTARKQQNAKVIFHLKMNVVNIPEKRRAIFRGNLMLCPHLGMQV